LTQRYASSDKRQHDARSNRHQRSHSSQPPHGPRQGYLAPQPLETSGAAGIPGLLLGFNGAYAPGGVVVHLV